MQMKWLLALLITIIPMTARSHAITCFDYGLFANQLRTVYGEERTHTGIAKSREMSTVIVEIWESKDHSTFSVLVVYPNGVACLPVSGENLKFDEDAFNEPT